MDTHDPHVGGPLKSTHAGRSLRADAPTLGQLHQWSRAGERAPHKPLLVLYAIGRTLRGEQRLVDFNDIEKPLADLISTFGPARQRVHPEYPFWRLQHDRFWEVVDADSFGTRQSNSDPPIAELRQRHAQGGFLAEVDDQIRNDAQGALDCAAGLSIRFFPHRETAVLDAVGVPR